MDRNSLLGWISAAGLVAALWYILVPAEPPGLSQPKPATTPPALALQPPAESSAWHAGGSSAMTAGLAPIEEDGKGWDRNDSLSTVAARYRAMRDKRRFADLALKAGGGAHLMYLAMAKSRCMQAEGRPGTVAAARRRFEAEGNPTDTQIADLRRLEGCEGFENRPLSDYEKFVFMTEVFGSWDPVMRALRVDPSPDGDGPAIARDLVRDGLAQGDLHLAFFLSHSMAYIRAWDARVAAGIPQSQHGPVPGLSEEKAAWTLAWCRVGIECDRYEGVTWDMSCQGFKQCGEDFAEAGVRIQLRDRNMDAVMERSRVLETAIRDRNWASIGF